MSLLLLLGGEGGGEPTPEPVEPFNVFRYPVQTQGKCTIRLLALDGVWETVGADRVRGVRHEGLSASANRWGSDTCRFTLKRQPGGVFPDLTAFTPIEIINPYGTLVWAGRIKETPSSDGDDFSIGVEGQGWQYHLDDDVYERVYVHTRLGDWKDARSAPEVPLNYYVAAPTISTDQNIAIVFPNGSAVVQNVSRGGVTLDLGQDSTAKRIVVEWENAGCAASTYTLVCRGHDIDDGGFFSNPGESAFSVDPASASSPSAGTLTTARRYVSIYLARVGPSITETADRGVKIKVIRVFRDTAYESGNESIFRATHWVKDALPFAPLLDQDTSLVDPDDTVQFDIPDAAMTDDRKPREAMEAANILHNYKLRVREDRKLEFRPLPTVPQFRVGAWSGADFKDASKNSGDDIYNRSIVKGTGSDGGPVKVNRYAAQQPNVPFGEPDAPAFSNPSFDVDTSGWSAPGVLARTTSQYHSSPAGLAWEPTGGLSDILEGDIVGPFRAGQSYRVSFYTRHTLAAPGATPSFRYRLGIGFDYEEVIDTISSGFAEKVITWTPLTDHDAATLMVFDYGAGPGRPTLLDTCVLTTGLPTLPDRRGFTRTHSHAMSQAIIPEVGQQIADTFLATHKRTPLKGDITVKGRGGMRRFLGDASVPPSELLVHTGELVHLANQVDPDTGALGRDAPIDSVTWSEDEDTASVALDAQRDNLAALLARYDLIAGAG